MTSDSVGPGSLLAGDFRLLQPLSSGGMGQVFVAEQLSTGRRRAVKVMHAGLLDSPALRERFAREARVGSLVRSDHVVEVVSAGVDPATGAPYIAMELLEGEDLARHISRLGPLPPGRALDLLRQLCHALGAAHAAGVVHRDIKPENVFVVSTRSAESGTQVKVLDFGIARIAAQMGTAHTGVIGTPLWMAPEQTDPSAEAGPAADVWAIGLVAFWMLTGKHFWRAAAIPSSSMHALMREILFDAIPLASLRAAQLGVTLQVPPGFDGWLSRALARDPAARFANAAEAFHALATALSGDVTASSPVNAALARTAVSPQWVAPPPPARGRAWWLAIPVLGLGLFGLGAAGLGAAYYAGLFEGPADAPAPSSPAQPSVEPPLETPTVVAPSATAEPVASGGPKQEKPRSAAAGPKTAASPATAAPAASAAHKPFDHAAAQTTLQQRASFAKLSCSSKPGPRAFGPSVQFRNGGTVQNVSMSPQDMSTGSGICVRMILSGARVPPYDGPLQSASVGVSLSPQ